MAWQPTQEQVHPVIIDITIITAVLEHIGSLVQSVVYVASNPRASKE
jgi:hypothetical protein